MSSKPKPPPSTLHSFLHLVSLVLNHQPSSPDTCQHLSSLNHITQTATTKPLFKFGLNLNNPPLNLWILNFCANLKPQTKPIYWKWQTQTLIGPSWQKWIQHTFHNSTLFPQTSPQLVTSTLNPQPSSNDPSTSLTTFECAPSTLTVYPLQNLELSTQGL